MKNVTIAENHLREIVTESVREALNTELMKLRALALPSVSQKEQREIEKALREADRSIGKRVRLSL